MTEIRMADMSVDFYPDSTGSHDGHSEVADSEHADVLNANGDVVLDDFEVRHHPEVPLTDDERDAVLRRLGVHRVGPWRKDGDHRATAPVVHDG